MSRKSHGLAFGTWHNRTSFLFYFNGQLLLSTSLVVVLVLLFLSGRPIRSLEGSFFAFRGRALLVNVLGLSLFWYQVSIFDIPKTVIFQINKNIFPFVWQKKREWLARMSVTQSIQAGGLGVVDVAHKVLSLRSNWLRRFFSPFILHPWQDFFVDQVQIGQRDALKVFRLNRIPVYRLRYLPSFSASLLRLWSQLKGGFVRDQWVLFCEDLTPLPIDQLTLRFSYVSLSCLADIPHRCIAKFSAFGFDVPLPHVWQLFDLWHFIRAVQDTAWLSFNGILPTTDRLLRFRMNVSSAFLWSR